MCHNVYLHKFISGKEESQEKERRFIRDVVCGPTTLASHGINSECRISGPTQNLLNQNQYCNKKWLTCTWKIEKHYTGNLYWRPIVNGRQHTYCSSPGTCFQQPQLSGTWFLMILFWVSPVWLSQFISSVCLTRRSRIISDCLNKFQKKSLVDFF